jgi:cytochrome c oxidase cbb3-type subunit 4
MIFIIPSPNQYHSLSLTSKIPLPLKKSMYQEVLSAIKDISIYPVFSFTVFFIFFLIIGVWVIRSKKEEFETVSKIPLSGNETN